MLYIKEHAIEIIFHVYKYSSNCIPQVFFLAFKSREAIHSLHMCAPSVQFYVSRQQFQVIKPWLPCSPRNTRACEASLGVL